MNTQRQRLAELFEASPNTWIPLPRITGLGIAMYPPRIKELRDEEHMHIVNKLEVVNGVKHSFYMYIPYNKEQKEFKFC